MKMDNKWNIMLKNEQKWMSGWSIRMKEKRNEEKKIKMSTYEKLSICVKENVKNEKEKWNEKEENKKI